MRLKIERSHPPHFAGRQRALAALLAHVNAIAEAPAEARAGMALIDGVQGVGKTALLNELTAQAARHGTVVSHVTTRELRDPSSLFVRMARSIGLRRTLWGAHAYNGCDLEALLVNTKDRRRWRGRCLLVVVDEVQNIDDTGMGAFAALHRGIHGCPVAVIGAGLQHALSVLANNHPSISRPAIHITLGSLEPAEAQEAIGVGLKNLGYRVDGETVARLAAASQGFPHHIWCYLAGAQSAIETRGALDTEEALRHALEEGSKRRIDYYWDRLSSMEHATPGAFQPMLAVAAAMADKHETGLTYRQAVAAIGTETAAGDDANAILENAVAKGVLTRERTGALSFGIPSFHAFMQDQLAEREQKRPGA